jgi:thioredoxin reductase (NADPH)
MRRVVSRRSRSTTFPAWPEISGQALVDRLMEQIAPFSPEFHFNRMVAGFRKLDNGRFEVETDEGELFHCHAVVIAAGGGSFQPKRPPVPGIEAYEGKSVYYSVRRMEEFRDRDLLIVGGGDSALDWTLNLQPVAKSVTLVHRRPDFRAAPDSVNKMFALRDEGKISFQVGQVTGLKGDDGQLSAATIKGPDGEVDIACDRLLPFFGLTMKLGPIADWGLNQHENLINGRYREVRNQHPGCLRHRRHQLVSGQAQADPVRLPRSGPDDPSGQADRASRPEAGVPVHHLVDQPAEEARRPVVVTQPKPVSRSTR